MISQFTSQTLFAFLTSYGFAIVFQIPKRHLLRGGAVGSLGWAIYWLLNHANGRPVLATFTAALSVGVISEILARWRREPAVMFVVPGIFPLVPGVLAYQAMLALANGENQQAVGLAVDTLFYGGAIAAGIAASVTLFRLRGRS